MTLFRTFDMVLVVVMVCAAAVTYKVKYDAQKRMADVTTIERQMRVERDTINLLHADWALMTQPARMQKLVGRFDKQLQLQVIEPRQIVSIQDIPERADQTMDPLQHNDSVKKKALAGQKNQANMLLDSLSTGTSGQ